jgi:hypothetical protein
MVRQRTHVFGLWDSDTRRLIVVTLPNPHGFDIFAHEADEDIPVKAGKALAKHLGHLPRATTVAIEVDERLRLLSYSTDPRDDETLGSDYLFVGEYQLPRQVANRTVLRSHLCELDRLLGADIVSYLPVRDTRPRQRNKDRYVFKYSPGSPTDSWTEIQIVARLPRHPNLVLLDRLVLDEQTGSKVVGFTTRFIPGGSLDQSKPRFKLKWLKQLMQVGWRARSKLGVMVQGSS